MTLTKQQRKVYTYILTHRGCTTRDIQRDTGIECPSARITEMRRDGVKIISIGKKKYPGAHAFEMYAVEGSVVKSKEERTQEWLRTRGLVISG